MKQTIFLVISLYTFLLFGCSAADSAKSKEENKVETLIVPVNIQNYQFRYAKELSSSYTLKSIESFFVDVNSIWKQANIEFVINKFNNVTIDDTIFLNRSFQDYSNREFRRVLEKLSQKHIDINSFSHQGVLTLVLIERFPHPAAGVWSKKSEIVFFAKRNNNQDTIANILAHEFGHSLSLDHMDSKQYPTNLMKVGDGDPLSAKDLTNWQVEKAREEALGFLKK